MELAFNSEDLIQFSIEFNISGKIIFSFQEAKKLTNGIKIIVVQAIKIICCRTIFFF